MKKYTSVYPIVLCCACVWTDQRGQFPTHNHLIPSLAWTGFVTCVSVFAKIKKIGKEKKLQPFTTSLPTTKKNGLICMKKYKKKASIFFKKNTKKWHSFRVFVSLLNWMNCQPKQFIQFNRDTHIKHFCKKHYTTTQFLNEDSQCYKYLHTIWKSIFNLCAKLTEKKMRKKTQIKTEIEL